MFEVWKLKRQIQSVQRSYGKDRKKLQEEKASRDKLGNKLGQLDANEYAEVREIEKEIDWVVGIRLYQEATSLDVETPPFSDEEMWEDDFGTRRRLTSKGRAHVRKLIHEERTRRFEAKSRWLPLLSVVLAIISALTGLVALTLQRKSADAAATAAGTARINAELARKQLVGTQQAIVVFSPNFSASKINPVLENRGHVVSSNAHINFRWGIAPLSNLDTLVRQGTYSHTIPQLVIGGWSEPVDIGVRLGQEFSGQKYTVRVDGTYDFDNGFGERFSDTFCYFYLAHYQAKTDDGGIENGGPGFWPCTDFTHKLRYVRTHPPR